MTARADWVGHGPGYGRGRTGRGNGGHACQGESRQPEDLTRLFVARANAGDAAGIAALYEPGAVMAYPPGSQTTGREAIQALWRRWWPARRGSSRNRRCPRW